MNYRIHLFPAILIIATVFTGCVSQRPMFYPNQQFETSSKSLVKSDVDDCIERAKSVGLITIDTEEIVKKTVLGAASGAAVGAAIGAITEEDHDVGERAATGAAGGGSRGLLWGLFSSREFDPVKKQFVEECLQKKGYKITGWE